MPTYEYQCEACNHAFEEIQSFNEPPVEKCPKCKKKKVKRLISGGLGFSIKGGTSSITSQGKVTYNPQAEAMGGRYVPMDSAEQKFEQRMSELKSSGEI
jgi:putative FmdB family regulatory protein